MRETDYLREEHHEFEKASRQALDNTGLQQVLSKLGDTLGVQNRLAWESFPDADQVREKARSIKEETLASLDTHLEQLEQSVEKLGGTVHWAETGDEACQQILDIIRQYDGKNVVKSKSMTTEEIHLNRFLEKENIRVTETDLGEFIVQQVDHRPSHIVGPALHMSVDEVQKILSDDAGEPLSKKPEELTAYARQRLRTEFASADIGISGVNYAIAETGTIVLVSNEGNARLTTSMPKVHIAVMGMEKVIPKLADLPYFLKVLARAATGQKLTVYTSLVTGKRGDEELDGPEHFHLVILDNGRSKILESPLRESLFCIRCGACLNACPIYRNIGGHAYGGVYSGPIGAVLTPLYDGLKENHHLPHASSLCGACEAACPVKIRIPEMLIQLRSDLHDTQGTESWLQRIGYNVWARNMRWSWAYRWGTWFSSRTIGRWKRKAGWITKLPFGLHGWTQSRDFPAPAPERFRDWWHKEGKDES
ncbi:MAG: iron-sulfur cluster-binding protein [Blastopirellula sp.]|nr:MAG: iron-sulfur cluster-binding protein [Blastopirellula sp.]